MKSLSKVALVLFCATFCVVLAKPFTSITAEVDSAGESSSYGLVGLPGHLEDYAQENGGSYYSGHHADHGKKGDKGFKNHQQYSKGKTSHSNFDEQSGQHGEKGGNKIRFHDEDGRHHHGYYLEKDEKGHKFGQRGEFKKGHSTKGTHEIHKLNEYKKNKEFFDEDYEQDEYEKHGGYQRQHESNGGQQIKLAHLNRNYGEGTFGKTNHIGNLLYYLGQLGKNNEKAQSNYYKNGEEYDKSKSLSERTIWGNGFGAF